MLDFYIILVNFKWFLSSKSENCILLLTNGVPKKITVKVSTSSTKERQHINVFVCTEYLNENGASSMLPKQ